MRENTRRWFLSAGITVAGTAIAGCTDADDGATDPGAENGSHTGTAQTGNRSEATTEQGVDDDADSGRGDDETTAADEESGTEQADDSESDEMEKNSDQESLFPDYETTEVRVETPDGEELGSVTAAIAETSDEWSLGLSETDSLPEDWGMLFVSGSMSDRTFWMKDMDFGLDIVFVDDEKRITGVHHAPAPGPDEDGTNQRYSGRGQYVFEVNYEWTDRHDVTEGDVLRFEL